MKGRRDVGEPLMLFRLEVLEDEGDEPYVYEAETWTTIVERLSNFDGLAVSYTITHYYPWAVSKEQ
jgi:hypothetical protein